jgi:hypothetical protein
MRYSTVKRDSALLEHYGLERQKIQALDKSLDELKTAVVLLKIEKNPVLGTRGKIDDVVYTGCVANIPKAATRTYLRAKLSC